jgi:hypothetical protein
VPKKEFKEKLKLKIQRSRVDKIQELLVLIFVHAGTSSSGFSSMDWENFRLENN